MKLLTVFTPVFNRKHLLGKLYDSLCAQTTKEFTWLIIDDGSTDGLGDLVSGWIAENKLCIKYKYQDNMGRHVASNTGIELCETEYIFGVDSDDLLMERAIEILHKYCLDEQHTDTVGVCGKKTNLHSPSETYNWPTSIKYAKFNDLYFRYH
jgi:glycosyltransferase involved in cell wall biosynthesis